MTFQDEIRNIPRDTIEENVRDGSFTIWSYYLDPVAAALGILAANGEQVGFFYLRNDGALVFQEPPGLVPVKETRFLIDKTARTFRIELRSRGEFRELVVFDDADKMGDSPSKADPVLLEEMDRTLDKWSTWANEARHISRARSWLDDQVDKLL